MEPLNIQLAIQGGGAKICALMAAIEAIEELEAKDVIKVTRIAGTSAGSIVGCLFAAGIKMETLRAYIITGEGQRLAALFSRPKTYKMLMKLYFGRPFWDENNLRTRLQHLFSEKKIVRLGQLYNARNVGVMICATNIAETQRHLYSSNQDGDKYVVEAILDSCGLPYCFRSWSSKLVDGGISENLVVEDLQREEQQYGPVIAITFDRQYGTPANNLTSFSGAILESAINNSVDRSLKTLSQDAIFSIDTAISTFDFVPALRVISEAPGGEYGRIKLKASGFFREFVSNRKQLQQKQHRIDIDPWAQVVSDDNRTAIQIMEDLGRVYENQHASSKFKYLHCSLVVKANSLRDPDVDDILSYSTAFKTLDEPISCMSIGLPETVGGQFASKTAVQVWNEMTHTEIHTIAVPSRDPKDKNARELLLFFVPVLQPNTGPYKYRLTHRFRDAMRPLRETGQDELVFCPKRADGVVEQIDLLLCIPETYGHVEMSPKNLQETGEQMTREQLFDYQPEYGYRFFGWTGKNVVSKEFGIWINRV